MANPGAAHPEADAPGPGPESRDVHGPVPDRILLGTQTVHDLQSRVHRGRVPHLLQRHGKLHLFPVRQLQLRDLHPRDVVPRGPAAARGLGHPPRFFAEDVGLLRIRMEQLFNPAVSPRCSVVAET